MKAQVGAEPIYHSWFRHFPFSDYEGLEVSRYIWLLQQVVEGVDKFERTYMVKKRARVRAPLSARKQRSAREREFAFWEVVMTLFPATNLSRRSLMQDEL